MNARRASHRGLPLAMAMAMAMAIALALAFAVAGWLWSATGARAQTAPLSCSVSLSTIAFGSVDVLPGNSVDTSGALSITCANVSAVSGNLYVCVALSARALQGPSSTLAYEITSGGQGSVSWSNTTPFVVPLASLQLNATVTYALTAVLAAAQQSAPPGSYSQSLTLTASFGLQSCTTGLPSTSTASAQVTATVVKSCNVSASDLGFGSVGTLSTAVMGQTALSMLCTKGTGYTVALDGGLSGATDPGARRMTGSGQSLTYGLYQDGARSRPWGASANATVGGTGSGSAQSFPVYGLVPAQPTPSAGTYSDTIVVTVTY